MKAIINLALFVFALFAINSCHLTRVVVHGGTGIDDYKIFPSRILATNDSLRFSFTESKKENINFNLTTIIEKHNWLIKIKEIGEYPLHDTTNTFDSFLESRETVAFIVIKEDTIIYEKYFDGYARESIFPSFSMAKSFISILIGCAIDDGFIKSVDQPVTDYIPELKKNGFDKVTINHLLQMTGGINFNENYSNPIGDVAKIYYSKNLRRIVYKLKLKNEAGKKFYYNSGESQVLGLVLERALKGKTITQYMQERLWQPIGMEYDATWSVDRENNGIEKTFCCFNARGLDFAKFGRLYLNNGNWNGRQIVSRSWVKESTVLNKLNKHPNYYQNQWWVGDDYFSAFGLGGQTIFVYPQKRIIIVRLGNDRGNINWDVMCNAISLGL